MSDRLEHELHIAGKTSGLSGPEVKAANAQACQDGIVDLAADEDGELPPAVAELIKRCLEGSEPIDESGTLPRHIEALDKFGARHINMVMLRAAGFKCGEIAQAMGCLASSVSIALNHPYGKKILYALMTARGTRVLDIRTKLDIYATEILDQVFDLTQKSADLELVSKVGFGLLDRAGYGTTQKVQHEVVRTPLATESTMSRLASAMEQSQTVDSHIIPAYVPKPPPDEGREQSLDVGSIHSDSSGSEAESLSGARLAKVSNG